MAGAFWEIQSGKFAIALDCCRIIGEGTFLRCVEGAEISLCEMGAPASGSLFKVDATKV